VETAKWAEDEDALIVRVYEADYGDTPAASLVTRYHARGSRLGGPARTQPTPRQCPRGQSDDAAGVPPARNQNASGSHTARLDCTLSVDTTRRQVALATGFRPVGPENRHLRHVHRKNLTHRIRWLSLAARIAPRMTSPSATAVTIPPNVGGDSPTAGQLAFDAALAYYRAGLNELESPGDDRGLYQRRIMRVLAARDSVAAVLSAHGTAGWAAEFLDLASLDERFQNGAEAIDRNVGRSELASWRASRQPPTGAWWWSLDECAAARQASQVSPLLTIAALLCFALFLAVAGDITRRFFSVGPDPVSILSVLSQAVLAFLAGSALTQPGRRLLEYVLSRFNVRATIHARWKAGLAALVLLIAIACWFSLPVIAGGYNAHGISLRNSGDITSAIDNFQRATSLNPDNAEGHYNLGSAYEDVLDYDKAIPEYQRAYVAGQGFDAAANNLAHIYILRRSDFGSALSLLNAALEHPEPSINAADDAQKNLWYTLHKNRAWALLGLKEPELAEADLARALEWKSDGASAHCLQAQAIEARDPSARPTAEWEACLRFQRNDSQVEATWLATARLRLIQDQNASQ
jgi:tetratricopeptide (TPR) repeat protein